MAWELATFSADLLREPEAIDGVEVEIIPPGSPALVTHVLDAVEPRRSEPVEIARRLGVSRMTVWRKLKAVEVEA